MTQHQLILSLIKDDIVNAKLVQGLNALQLDATHYLLHLSQTVFTLMELDATLENEPLYERYHQLVRNALHIDVSRSHTVLDAVAQQIYEELQNWKQNLRTPASE